MHALVGLFFSFAFVNLVSVRLSLSSASLYKRCATDLSPECVTTSRSRLPPLLQRTHPYTDLALSRVVCLISALLSFYFPRTAVYNPTRIMINADEVVAKMASADISSSDYAKRTRKLIQLITVLRAIG